MSTKKKLIATISMFCLTCAMILVGVWAVSSANIEIGGKITFQATHVNAKVTGSISGGSLEENYVPDALEYTATTSPTTTALNTWKKDLSFTDTNTTITMTINVENRSTERCLYVSIADTVGDVANLTKTTKHGETVLTNGQDIEVTPETTETFTITMSLDSIDLSVDSTWNYLVNLTDATEQHTISTKYSIEDGEVYKTTYCTDCGREGTKTKMSENSYIIATPETIQDILDGDINGKTVVLSAGEYTDPIELRPTAETVSAIYTLTSEGRIDTEVTGELDNATEYAYLREFNNVTIAGVEGANLKNYFSIEATEVAENTSVITDKYDKVKDMDITESTVGYHARMNLSNVTITGLNFSGTDARMFLVFEKTISGIGISNLTIENNKFYTTGVTGSSYGNLSFAAAIYSVYSMGCNDGIKFLNNDIDGYYQGIYTYQSNNLLIANNTIKNTVHNAIAIQSHDTNTTGSYFTGNIEIKNNTIEDTTDRAIRFGTGKNATIVIENNTFKNATEANGNFIKSQVMSGSTYSFMYNSYNDILVDNGNANQIDYVLIKDNDASFYSYLNITYWDTTSEAWLINQCYVSEENADLVIPKTVSNEGIEYTITYLEMNAFLNQTNLTSIVLPDSVSFIENGVFSGCNNLKSVTLLSNEMVELETVSAFGNNHADLVIYVPNDLVDTYKSNELWASFNIQSI